MSRLSGELEYRIRYDVEHNLFYAKNVFNEEYIPPTFIEYVQKLEALLIKAKELIKRLMQELVVSNTPYDEVKLLVEDVEQFLKE